MILGLVVIARQEKRWRVYGVAEMGFIVFLRKEKGRREKDGKILDTRKLVTRDNAFQQQILQEHIHTPLKILPTIKNHLYTTHRSSPQTQIHSDPSPS